MATLEPQRGASAALLHASSAAGAVGTRPSADADVYVAHDDAHPHPPIRYTRLPPITLIQPVANAATRIGLFRELSTLSAMTMNSTTTVSTSTTTSATIVRRPQPRQQQALSLTRALANRLGWSSTREEGREEEGEGDDDPSLVVGLSRAQVEAAERYRWASFFVILMYVVTFFAWPSYFMSAFGLATGIVGYVSYRLTQERVPHHMISVVMFVACNYAMMVFLVWVFVSFFVVTLQQKSTGQPALMLLIVFMSIGLFLHFRVQRVARDFMNAFKPGVTRTEPPRPRRPIAITIARPPRQPFVADDASSYLPTTNVAQAAPS